MLPFISQLYVNYVREFGLQWIGLIFKFPLILHPIPNYREDNYVDKNQERKRWQLVEMLGGFHAEETTTQLIPYDFRETCFAQHSQLVSSYSD
jgi:hypothetical protein